MSSASVRELLEAGVHFGHKTKRWNPRMEDYIFEERNKIHIIDLRKTKELLNAAQKFIMTQVIEGRDMLFVGTKKQCRELVREAAVRSGMHYVIDRWLGGTLTNFQTIRSSVKRLEELEAIRKEGLGGRSKKEIASLRREEFKLHRNLDGIRYLTDLPAAVVVIDILREHNAVKEAVKLGIPIVAIVDTNCDPTPIDYPIPGNDDGIRATKLIFSKIEEAVSEGNAGRVKKRPSRKKKEEKDKALPAEETAPKPEPADEDISGEAAKDLKTAEE